MAIIRKGKTGEDQYTTILNVTLRDTRLSLTARGLLVYLLSMPGNWCVNAKHLAAENGNNVKTIYNLLSELIATGYCERRKLNSGRVEYAIYEKPISEKRIEDKNQTPTPKIPKSEKACFRFSEDIQSKESIQSNKDSCTPPAREENPQIQVEPKTPHDWAQYFIQRCGYRLDQAITPKSMAIFRQWIADGVTLEDVEDGASAAEAKLGAIPANPTYYRGFVAEVVIEKQRAKENPANLGDLSGFTKKKQPTKRILPHDNFENKQYIGTPTAEIWWMQ